MVAKITSPLSCRLVIEYHEKKVKAGVAEFLCASNFLKDIQKLSIADKKDCFQRLHALNKNTSRYTLQVVLGFPREEKLAKEKLIAIAVEYMEKIGFGQQPYLVYEHRDAGAPHLHIVTTIIRHDGSLIKQHNIGKLKSVPACKAINVKHRLMGKQIGKTTRPDKNEPVQKLQYGKMETGKSIKLVLDYVWRNYRFTSFEEFNAVLRQYNMRAFTGRPGGRIHKNKGLVYQMLNEQGKAIGGRVKASDMPFKAGLSALSQKYRENRLRREQDLERIRSLISLSNQKKPANMDQLVADLQNEKIQVIPHNGDKGLAKEYIFIDHQTYAVATDSHLGEAYRLEAIRKKMPVSKDQHKEQTIKNNRSHLL
jgi:hypothetical protein